jgi:uncharacterized membrane protein YGL010W
MKLIKLLYPILFGLVCPPILNYLGILTGDDGVEYYAEVHQTFHNAMVHTVFMPFTIYGMLLWIPNTLLYLFRMLNIKGPDFSINTPNAIYIQYCFYCAYMTHYLTISGRIGLLLILLYAGPFYYARKYYITNKTQHVIKHGFAVSTVTLVIQEVFGHYYGGEGLSRFEAIFNATLYATYFSVGHLFR